MKILSIILSATMLSSAAMAETAVDKLLALANAGDVEAQAVVGYHMTHGIGFTDGGAIEKDLKQAETWLLKAAKQNHPLALYSLGTLYADGARANEFSDEEPVIKKNQMTASGFFHRFVETGEKKEAQASDGEKKWLAEHLPLAMAMLGDMYYQECDPTPSSLISFVQCGRDQEGWPVSQSYADAYSWYQRAAKRNHPWAHYQVGRIYELGRSVPQDFKLAIDHYHQAANLCVPQARFALGNLYQRTGDNAAAYMWFNLAVLGAQDNDDAFIKYRDAALAKLSPQEVKRSQTQARAWHEANGATCPPRL